MSTAEKQQFLYFFEAIRPELITNPEAWTKEDREIGKAHYSYLKQATETGIVILAGRSTDGLGPAIVIIEVESEVSARDLMENDPFVKYGLMRASLHPFRAALMRKV